MAVMAVISAVLAFTLPAVNALMQSSGRRGAIDEVMAMLDRARMCAIAEGRPASLVFADDRIGALERRFRAVAIFEDNADPAGLPVMITPWRILPTGVAFDSTQPSVFTAAPETFSDGVTAVSFPVPNEGSLALPHLKFSPTGSVLFPANASTAGVAIAAGHPGKGKIAVSGAGATVDRIEVSTATGWPKFVSGSSPKPAVTP